MQLEWGCPNGTKYPPRQPIPNRAILPNRARLQTDGRTGWFQYTPPNFVAGGIIIKNVILHADTITYLVNSRPSIEIYQVWPGCVCETRMPPAAIMSKSVKISKSYILTLHHPKEHVVSVKCEQPLNEIKVQVWLLYAHPSFKYCTLTVSGKELWTDKWSDYYMPKVDLSGWGIKNMKGPVYFYRPNKCFILQMTFICVHSTQLEY